MNFFRIILLLIIISCPSCKNSNKSNQFKQGHVLNPKENIELPTLKINTSQYTSIENLHFNHSVGGKPIQEETKVQMTYDKDYLKINFECRNNPRMNQNYYIMDNSPMFTQEVFEIFISKGKMAKEKYIEIQLNPNNALYLARITNRFKSDGKFKNEPIDNNTAGVLHEVVKDSQNETWRGSLQIPLKLLDYPQSTSDNIYRMNLYRIISNQDQNPEEKWRNNAKNSTYACWNSTKSSKPNFHRPEYFGFLILE